MSAPAGVLSISNNILHPTLGVPFSGAVSSGAPSWGMSGTSFVPGAPTATKTDRNQYAQGFPSNTTINNHLHLRLPDTKEEAIENIGMNELQWVRNNERKDRMEPGRRYETMNLRKLNDHLKTPEMRKLYGSEVTATKLKNDWKFYGVATRDLVDYGSSGTEVVIAFTVGLRARVANIWLATGQDVTVGSHGFIVWQRLPYVPLASIDDMDEDDENRADNRHQEHYWEGRPYVCQGNGNPPPCLYITDSFVGYYEFIGTVTKFYGYLGKNEDQHRNAARMALKCQETGTTYRHSYLRKIQEVEIQIGVR